ncbi:MAG: TSUP family transporter [Fidelibacterota bacterium]
MDWLLSILFFFVALLYSSVGLGGGSSYTALMAITGVDHRLIPTISLTLNLVVTSLGVFHFWRNGYGRLGLILPFLVTSVPMAYLAGSMNLSRTIFLGLLLATLCLVVIRIYFLSRLQFSLDLKGLSRWAVIVGLGALLGFVAGAVGIGGGIYLVPLLIMFRLASEKEAAATGTIFIWVNSLTGIIARFQWGAYDLPFMVPLLVAVIVGGFAGSYFGAVRFRPQTIQKVMGIVVVIAIIILGKRLIWSL